MQPGLCPGPHWGNLQRSPVLLAEKGRLPVRGRDRKEGKGWDGVGRGEREVGREGGNRRGK